LKFEHKPINRHSLMSQGHITAPSSIMSHGWDFSNELLWFFFYSMMNGWEDECWTCTGPTFINWSWLQTLEHCMMTQWILVRQSLYHWWYDLFHILNHRQLCFDNCVIKRTADIFSCWSALGFGNAKCIYFQYSDCNLFSCLLGYIIYFLICHSNYCSCWGRYEKIFFLRPDLANKCFPNSS
jgi:hypothetical protein